jgi:pSer/pThr/pTyr-binding forkhead associated (FHA) protein
LFVETKSAVGPYAFQPLKMELMTSRAPGRLQGDDLIGEVLRNMEEGLFRIRQKTLVPAIYRIYLSLDDYEPFRDVVPFIAGEIRTALDERLASWNASPRKIAAGLLKKFGAGEAIAPNQFVRVADSWIVEIYPDLDGKLQPGEIEVHSELGSPQKADYGGGSLTRRINVKKPEPPAEAEAEPEPEPAAAPTTRTPATPLTPPASEIQAESHTSEQTKGLVLAYLRFADQHGQQSFEVTKNQVVIGRGGRSYWVDLRLDTLPDVSREHCRIRRDNETGRFTIEDVSQFGTAVNGKPVGRNASAELPRRATISLAGVIDLQWEAV